MQVRTFCVTQSHEKVIANLRGRNGTGVLAISQEKKKSSRRNLTQLLEMAKSRIREAEGDLDLKELTMARSQVHILANLPIDFHRLHPMLLF